MTNDGNTFDLTIVQNVTKGYDGKVSKYKKTSLTNAVIPISFDY